MQREDQEEKTQEAAPRSLILTTEQRAALLADIGRVMGKVEEFCSTADNDRYGHYTIKAISESVGYKSQANFINIFTRLTGMKPSIYQKISRERISIEKSC